MGVHRKILILASWYPSDRFPVEGIFIQEQAVTLAKEYDVAVLAPKMIGWREMIKGKIRPRLQTELRAGLKVFREYMLIPVPRIQGPVRYYLYNWAARRGFERLISVWGKPDLIHAHVVLPGGWAAVHLGKQYSLPVVLTEHSRFSVYLGTSYQRCLCKDTLQGVNRLIAVSPALAKEIHTFHDPVEIEVIGNVIKTQFFYPLRDICRESDKPITRFLSIALLTKIKGLSYLLEAAQLLVQRGCRAFELIIGGDGPDRSSLEQMARGMGLAGQCHFPGLLTPEQVRDWMQRCDIFVLPSLKETFGVVLGEAMACGKPVISTRCGGPEYVVTPDTGVLINPANSQELAEAMEGFISGRLTYNSRLIRQSVVDRFGEEAFLRNMSALYEKI